MIHMLSSFDLKLNEEFDNFIDDYEEFIAGLRALDMVVDADPIGRRVKDTPMDTDEGRKQHYYSVMHFRDRAQLDAAYAHIEANAQPNTSIHLSMYQRLKNAVFLCWDDTELGKDKT